MKPIVTKLEPLQRKQFLWFLYNHKAYCLTALEYARHMFIFCDIYLILYPSSFCFNHKLTTLQHRLYQCINHFWSLIVPHLLQQFAILNRASRLLDRWLNSSINRLWSRSLKWIYKLSSGFKSEDCRGHSMTGTWFSRRKSRTYWAVWHEALSCIKIKGFWYATCIVSCSNGCRISSIRENNPSYSISSYSSASIPPFITNDQWIQSTTSKTRPDHYLNLCTVKCFLYIPPIQPFAI